MNANGNQPANQPVPPLWATRFLKWYCNEQLVEEIEGDLCEAFRERVNTKGLWIAKLLYVLDVIRFIRPFTLERPPNPYPSHSASMMRHTLTLLLRVSVKQGPYAVLNIAGLAIGMACALLLLFHVQDELSYDRGFAKSDRLYRVTFHLLGENNQHWAVAPPVVARQLGAFLPEIEQTGRFYQPFTNRVFNYTPRKGTPREFEEKRGFYADSSVIDMFDLQFVKGNPQTALREPDALVLTEELARKYFGEEDPIGKIIVDKAGIDVARDSESVPLRVTGVVKKLPFRSHLQFDYLIAITVMEKRLPPEWIFGMTWKGFSTYALLRENTSREQVEARLEDFVEKFYAPWRLTREQALATARFYLQAIPDIHLHSKLEAETSQNSEVVYVYLLSLIAVFILFVAGINFVNISTAQAFYRMKEVGVRKALGARKGQLARQFTAESLLFTALAAGLALLLFAAATPFYEGLTGKDFHYSQVVTGRNLGFVVLLVVTTGVAAGAYPAWFVANFNVVTAIKGKKAPAASVNLVRKGLVVFQFVVAIVMIFSTIVIYQQLRFFNQKKLGFDKEQVIAVRLTAAMWRSIEPLKAALAGESAISAVSLVSSSPGDYYGVFDVYNLEVPFSGNAADIIRLKMMFTDENFLSTLGLTLKEGNNFTKQTAGAEAAYILNEQAVKILKLENPIGKRIRGGDENGRVVGVVKDFHYGSLHENIGGFVIKYATRRDLSNYMLLKIKGSSLRNSLKSVEKTIRRYAPGNTLFYTFLDEKIGRLYQTEARMSQVFEYFAALTVLISCLGLFGLSAYAAQLRLKEIGIRKVFGASVPRVIWELSRDFLWLVLIATLLASPLAWYFMSRWLENFAYRIELDPYLLVLSGVLALVIAFLTISYQTVKAALANPIHSLRTE